MKCLASDLDTEPVWAMLFAGGFEQNVQDFKHSFLGIESSYMQVTEASKNLNICMIWPKPKPENTIKSVTLTRTCPLLAEPCDNRFSWRLFQHFAAKSDL